MFRLECRNIVSCILKIRKKIPKIYRKFDRELLCWRIVGTYRWFEVPTISTFYLRCTLLGKLKKIFKLLWKIVKIGWVHFSGDTNFWLLSFWTLLFDRRSLWSGFHYQNIVLTFYYNYGCWWNLSEKLTLRWKSDT